MIAIKNSTLLGLCLSLITVIFWGTLPIALKQVASTVDALTIVWLRFTVAAVWIWLYLPLPKKMKNAQIACTPRYLLFFAIATLALGSNFVLYNLSVVYLNAPAAQMISQAGPILLMLGTVLFLHEPICGIQILGGIVLTAGLLLFFNDRLSELLTLSQGYGLGIAVGLTAALSWALYGVVQKKLLSIVEPSTTLRVIYTGVALGLIPFSSPSTITQLDIWQGICLCYCCINTIVAYGAFSKAMSVWHTAGVGGILSLTPLCTIAATHLAFLAFPTFFPDVSLNFLSYIGAGVVVLGAVLLAVGSHLGRFFEKISGH